ncbi:hypothetical protein ACMYYO_13800 [Dermacoccaceae bacterium W4C1]
MVEYLMVFPEPEAAQELAQRWESEEDFTEVRVGEMEDAGHGRPEWGVIVRVDTIDDVTGAVARALTDRLTEESTGRGGRLDGVR